MKDKLKNLVKSISQGPLQPFFSLGCRALNMAEYRVLSVIWYLSGARKPSREEAQWMTEQVTFIYKSFERQKMAKRLYRNIQSYYPGVRVIIADDSSKPLELKGENLTVLQLPYNSGLSYGLNRALEQVETPYVIRMDDDELLTPYTRFEMQLKLMMKYPQIDMVGVLPYTAPGLRKIEKVAQDYMKNPVNCKPDMFGVVRYHWIDKTHVILNRTPNIFLVKTEKLRAVGYDDNIRMLDHTEFFIRAAGIIHTVMDTTSFVFHYHDCFDWNYIQYRRDIDGDYTYIEKKLARLDREKQEALLKR